MQYIELISHILFTFALGFYLILNLQWYNYKFQRVVFHHKKIHWHLFYFLIPLFAYYLIKSSLIVLIPFVIALFLWYKNLDKKLILTKRVKRFFLFLALSVLFLDILCLSSQKCEIFGVLFPLFIAFLASYLFEKMLFLGFKKDAIKKLNSIDNLIIIAITASYGKTSIKNFLSQILSNHFKTYATPRSVNTYAGIMQDINNNLPNDCEIYIVEAGARLKGDINEIATFINHDYAIVGKIGPQHIEYFKTLENIRNTKMELLNSKKLKYAFVHDSANVKPNKKVEIFGKNITNIKSTLKRLCFDLKIDDRVYHFKTPLLGEFNAINISAAILVAHKLGVDIKSIQKAVENLKGVPHRLQKIISNGKLIIDDSFNGNFDGMSSSYDLAKQHKGRKVLITPGVLESDEKTNIALAKKIDEIFDLVIITGATNAKILDNHIKNAQKIILKDKSTLQDTLAKNTKAGDLILFSNDAPTFM